MSDERVRDLERKALLMPTLASVDAWARELARAGDRDPLLMLRALVRLGVLRRRQVRLHSHLVRMRSSSERRRDGLADRIEAEMLRIERNLVQIRRPRFPFWAHVVPIAKLLQAGGPEVDDMVKGLASAQLHGLARACLRSEHRQERDARRREAALRAEEARTRPSRSP